LEEDETAQGGLFLATEELSLKTKELGQLQPEPSCVEADLIDIRMDRKAGELNSGFCSGLEAIAEKLKTSLTSQDAEQGLGCFGSRCQRNLGECSGF
jgi:hypothetical protein